MIKNLWLKVDRKNAFDHGVCGVNPAVTPSKFQIVVEIEDSALLSVLRFADGSVEVVVECVDKPLSSSGTCR